MGSAANALIDRLPRGEKWGAGRSHCDKCGRKLEWYDLIPVVSWLALRGRCRYCHSPIPYRNLVVEVLMGVGFLLIFNQFSNFQIFQTLVLMGIFWVTTIIAVMDWETKLVSEAMVVVWGLLILIFNFQFSIFNQLLINNFQNNVLGLLTGLFLIGGLWAVSRGKAMGFGDVEIAAVAGWWLGWPAIGVAIWIAFVSGAAAGLVEIVLGKAKMKSEIPFGPFLVFGTWAAFFWGERLLKIFNF